MEMEDHTGNDSYPFPFFGAGFYEKRYEGIYTYLRFKNIPDKEQKKKITDLSPELFRPEAEYFYGKIFEIRNQQRDDLNEFIEEKYGDPEKPAADFHSLSEAAQTGPVNDLENWIKTIHGICPVEFAFRFDAWRNASENRDQYQVENIFRNNGPLQISPASDWHRESILRISELLRIWSEEHHSPDPGSQEHQRFENLVHWILRIGGQNANEIPENIIDRYFTLIKMQDLFRANFETGAAYYRKQKNIAFVTPELHLRSMITSFGENNPEGVLSFSEDFFHSANRHFLTGAFPYFLYAAIIQEAHELISRLIDKITASPYAASCILEADSFIRKKLNPKKEFANSIRMYEKILPVLVPANNAHFEIFNNALRLMLSSNTGLPVDREKNIVFLNASLPHASKNPAICLNAACLYNEMQEYEKAIDCLEKADELSCIELPVLLHQIRTEKGFEKLRVYPQVQRLTAGK